MVLKRCISPVLFCAALLFQAANVEAQDLGHKLPGLLGLDAGRVPEPGLYLIGRVVNYRAGKLRDRNGNLIAAGLLDLRASAVGFGLSYTTQLSKDSAFLTMTVAGPIARVRVNVQDRPEANVDRFGLGDVYIQPVRLAWRKDRYDLVTSYAVYLPTGRSALAGGSGASSGQVTHEFSLGGTLYGEDRTQFLTALAGYQLNTRQSGIDITRGDTVQIQGGMGAKLFARRVEAGLAGFALWQVRDARGADLPPALRGARDRVYGLGPEVAVLFPSIRTQVRVRYEWDIKVRSRPQGHIFVAGIVFAAHRPPTSNP